MGVKPTAFSRLDWGSTRRTCLALAPITKRDASTGHYVTVKGQPACESPLLLKIFELWMARGNADNATAMVSSGAGVIQYENAEQSPCFYFRAGRPVVILGRRDEDGKMFVWFRFPGSDTSTYCTRPEFLIAR